MARPTSPSRAEAISRAPALLTLLVALVAALAVFGTGVGDSAAAAPWVDGPLGDVDRTLRSSATVRDDDGEAAAAASDEAEKASSSDGVPEVPEPEATEIFATVGSLELHALSDAVQFNGFHQASSPGSRAMSPVGDRNSVLPSRGRGYPATSAVDVVLVKDEPVTSPVSGTVVDNEPYQLYGRTNDRRVTIRSSDYPHLEVVILHVAGVKVGAGEEVVGGETVIANSARKLPFTSQVDAETAPEAWPHVHLEVKDRG